MTQRILGISSTLIFLLSSTLSFSVPAIPADGSFTATTACPAYVSKNKKTNPDNAKITTGTTYPVIEVNTANDPEWYRLRVNEANPPERWIDVKCGTPKVATTENSSNSGTTTTGSTGESGGKGSDCTTAGLADGYVFAVSWQSAFCETHRSKPECNSATSQSWSANNFTLHGLWPNLAKCGIDYGFCSPQPKQTAFCNYPSLPLSPSVSKSLGQVMPSAAAGSCLQLHEWYKHGTCQKEWTADGYFEIAIDLARQFNESGISSFVDKHIGKKVMTQDFLNEIDRDLGTGAHERMKLTCQGGDLVDIYMNLPATIPATPKLAELLPQGKTGFNSTCGDSFHVDAVGYQR
ncbi:ribonuclease T2 [Gammaproteobacteria bacterium]